MKGLMISGLVLTGIVGITGCNLWDPTFPEKNNYLEKDYKEAQPEEVAGYYLNNFSPYGYLLLKNDGKFELREAHRAEENQGTKKDFQSSWVRILRGNWRIKFGKFVFLEKITSQNITPAPPMSYTSLYGEVKKADDGKIIITGVSPTFDPEKPDVWVKY